MQEAPFAGAFFVVSGASFACDTCGETSQITELKTGFPLGFKRLANCQDEESIAAENLAR